MLRAVEAEAPDLLPWVLSCYGTPTPLHCRGNVIPSAQGVQQGDPLGPLLFALTWHPIALRIERETQLLWQSWYLDDGVLVGTIAELSRALNIIFEMAPGLGVEVNCAPGKSSLWGPGPEAPASSNLASIACLPWLPARRRLEPRRRPAVG